MTDLALEVEIVSGSVIRVVDDYFPISWAILDKIGCVAHLPMENGTFLRLIVTPFMATCSLRLGMGLLIRGNPYAGLPLGVQAGRIVSCQKQVWAEDVKESYDLRSWLRQLGNLPVDID